MAKLILSIKDTSESTVNVAVCSKQLPYLWNGNHYNLEGTFIKTLVHAAGCDSVTKLVLSLKDTPESKVDVAL